jgi:hypothetical protein
MARRVYFHVGLPKTGTTFLQTTMWHNRRLLKEQGFLYPGSRRMDHYHAAQVVRGTPPERMDRDAGVWDRIVAELAAWEGDGLVSHEFFSMASRRQARRAVRALEPAEVHVVVTVRDYVRQFPAVWQEALKMNSELSLDEFMEQVLAFETTGAWGWASQDIPAVLRRWSKAVPADRIHVVTVPPQGAPRHLLWDRWCEVLGIDDSAFDRELSFTNESLGVQQVALLHRVKPYLSPPLTDGSVRHRWVRKYFGHQVLVPQKGERFGLRPEQEQALRDLSAAAAEAITAGGFPVTGSLDDLVPTESHPERPHPDDVSETEMLDVAAQAIDQMIRDIRQLSIERDEWRRQAQRPTPAPEPAPPTVGHRVRARLRNALRKAIGR